MAWHYLPMAHLTKTDKLYPNTDYELYSLYQRDETTYPFPNANHVAVDVWEWISYFIPHLVGMWLPIPTAVLCSMLINVSKGGLWIYCVRVGMEIIKHHTNHVTHLKVLFDIERFNIILHSEFTPGAVTRTYHGFNVMNATDAMNILL